MRFSPYPEYKDSGIDWLGPAPAHWTVKRLRHIALLNPGKGPLRRLPPETEVTFLPMEAVGDDGSLDRRQTKSLGDVIEGYTYLGERDVAFAKITPCFENGKAALATNLKNQLALASTELTVLRPHARAVSARYLYRLITSRPFRELGEASMYGAGGQKRVPDNFARDFAIPLPPPDEQRQIADFLDHETARIDGLIEEQQRLIKFIQEKRTAIISHAVTKGLEPSASRKETGVTWLGDVPAHWSVTPLRHAGKLITGVTPPSEDLENYSEDGMPWVRPDDLDESGQPVRASQFVTFQGWEYCRPVAAGSTLVCGIGSIGKVGYVDQTVATNQQVTAIQPTKCHGFLFYAIAAAKPEIDRSAVGNVLRIINADRLGEVKVAIPPESEARQISDFLDQTTRRMDDLVDEAEKGIQLLSERRSALISAAVTGKIDVRGREQSALSTEQSLPQVAGEEGRYG